MIKRNDSAQDFVDPFLVNDYIKEASWIMFNRKMLNLNTEEDTDVVNLNERSAIATTFTNAIFPRLDLNSCKMMLSYLKNTWPDITIPERFRLSIKNNIKFLNLPVYMEKETCMQIDDKLVLDDVADAVCVATSKLKLASSILFQNKTINIIENLKSCKNLLLIGTRFFFLLP